MRDGGTRKEESAAIYKGKQGRQGGRQKGRRGEGIRRQGRGGRGTRIRTGRRGGGRRRGIGIEEMEEHDSGEDYLWDYRHQIDFKVSRRG